MMTKYRLFNVISFIVTFAIGAVSFILHFNEFIPTFVIGILCAVSFYLFLILFEYQRITLVIARYISKKIYSDNVQSITMIQELLGNHILLFITTLLEMVLTGLIIGTLLRISIWLVGAYLVVKYILLAFIKVPLPYNLLFMTFDKALSNAGNELNITPGGSFLFIEILNISKQMPHNKTYEDWIYKQMTTVYK